MDTMLLSPQGKLELKKYGSSSIGIKNGFNAGCTANVVLITQTTIYCANAGDARSVLCENGKALPLSKDHKPELQLERKRITAAGRRVIAGRVDGTLAISRAIGDWEFKNPKLPLEKMAVIALPEVTKTEITP